MEDKEILECINRTNKLFYDLDKKVALISADIVHIKNKIDFHAQLIDNINIEFKQLKERSLLEEHQDQLKKVRWSFVLRNWRLLLVVFSLLIGLYEGGKTLLYMDPPRKAQHDIIDNRRR